MNLMILLNMAQLWLLYNIITDFQLFNVMGGWFI